jgi:hypothetical protein
VRAVEEAPTGCREDQRLGAAVGGRRLSSGFLDW